MTICTDIIYILLLPSQTYRSLLAPRKKAFRSISYKLWKLTSNYVHHVLYLRHIQTTATHNHEKHQVFNIKRKFHQHYIHSLGWTPQWWNTLNECKKNKKEVYLSYIQISFDHELFSLQLGGLILS